MLATAHARRLYRRYVFRELARKEISMERRGASYGT
jgi:hypothetical protein